MEDAKYEYKGDLGKKIPGPGRSDYIFGDIDGKCRRYPPAIRFNCRGELIPHEPSSSANFPGTCAKDLCGEWTPMPGNHTPLKHPIKEDKLSLPIDVLFEHLSVRVQNAIQSTGRDIFTIGDLMNYGSDQIRFRNTRDFGKVAISQIHTALARFGLRFTWGPEFPPDKM